MDRPPETNPPRPALLLEVHNDYRGAGSYFVLHGDWTEGPEAHIRFNPRLTHPSQFIPDSAHLDAVQVETGPNGVMAQRNPFDFVIVLGQCGGGGPGGGG